MAGITLNQAERRELISALVHNCNGWDEDDVDLLTNLSANKLVGHVQNCADMTELANFVANADPEDDSGLPGSLEPDSAGAQESAAETEGWEEENDPPGNQEPKGPTIKQDEEKDQPTSKTKKVSMEVTENQWSEQWLDRAPPAIREVVINALQFQNEQKRQLVTRITTNQKNRFNEDYLMNHSVEELQAWADMVAPAQQGRRQPIFAGAAGGPVFNEDPIDRDDILDIPTLEFATN